MNLIKRFFFKDTKISTFFITRLAANQLQEKVFLQKGFYQTDITMHHGMICLEPFCMAAWLPAQELARIDPQEVNIRFVNGKKLNALIKVSLIEKMDTQTGTLLLFKISDVKNYQLNPLHRLVLFAYFLHSKKNTYHSRKVISALYSYPRNIIIVSYRDESYYNIFPMDIHASIDQDELYILGLRTTNITLDKILESKKVVICDTDSVNIKTVYDLGKHSSSAPTPIKDLPFGVTESEKFGFPVPDFTGCYKEIEIIGHKKMGYHMLLIGKVVNQKKLKESSLQLYHVGFLQFQKSNYKSIEGLF